MFLISDSSIKIPLKFVDQKPKSLSNSLIKIRFLTQFHWSNSLSWFLRKARSNLSFPASISIEILCDSTPWQFDNLCNLNHPLLFPLWPFIDQQCSPVDPFPSRLCNLATSPYVIQPLTSLPTQSSVVINSAALQPHGPLFFHKGNATTFCEYF